METNQTGFLLNCTSECLLSWDCHNRLWNSHGKLSHEGRLAHLAPPGTIYHMRRVLSAVALVARLPRGTSHIFTHSLFLPCDLALRSSACKSRQRKGGHPDVFIIIALNTPIRVASPVSSITPAIPSSIGASNCLGLFFFFFLKDRLTSARLPAGRPSSFSAQQSISLSEPAKRPSLSAPG